MYSVKHYEILNLHDKLPYTFLSMQKYYIGYKWLPKKNRKLQKRTLTCHSLLFLKTECLEYI